MRKGRYVLGMMIMAGMFLVSTGVFAAEYKWRMAMSWGSGTPILENAAVRFADNVKKMTGGRMEITIDAAGKHKAPFGIFDFVRTGAYEMGHTTSYYYKGKDPAAAFFTTVPFGMNALEQNAWFYYGGGQELMNKIYAKHNIVIFNAGNTQNQMGGWFKKEIKSLKDLKGLKMRIPGHAGDVVERAGVKPTLIPAGELYMALERGTLDALEWVNPALDLPLGFQKIAKYYYTGWHEPAAELQVFVNKEKFDALPEDLKTIIQVAAKESSLDMLSESVYRNTLAWEKLVKEDKVQVRTFPKDVLAAFKKANDQLLNEMAAKTPELKEVLDSQRAFLSKAKEWTRVSELEYLRIR